MTRADFLMKIESLLKEQLIEDSIIKVQVIGDTALYVTRPDCKLVIKFEVVVTNRVNQFNALHALVLSADHDVDQQLFPFSLLEAKPTESDVAAESEFYIDRSPGGKEDWFGKEPESYDKMINQIINYCEIWHDLPE